jgi:hypothetical protein
MRRGSKKVRKGEAAVEGVGYELSVSGKEPTSI